MAFDDFLIKNKIKPLYEAAPKNKCIFSGATTDLRLPNGDYIDIHYYNDLKKKKHIDENDNYTDKFFKDLEGFYPYREPNGCVHIICHVDLEVALENNNKEAYSLLKEALKNTVN